MPNFCAAPNCTRKSTQCDLAFFRFPRDPNRCQKWVENCRRYDLENKTPDQLNKHYRLCAQHFEDSMICRSSPYRTVLREDAVPTIFDLTSHLINPGRCRKRIKELSEDEIRLLKERKRTEMVFGIHHSFLMASKSFLDTELLIALVRLHPELYDPQHRSYTDSGRRGTLWNKISSEMFTDWEELNPQQRSMKVREVQAQWRSLTENFRQELYSQMRQEFPSPGTEKPTCSHFKELLFLQPLLGTDRNAGHHPSPTSRTNEGAEEEGDIQIVCIKEEPPSPHKFTERDSETPEPTHYRIDPQNLKEEMDHRLSIDGVEDLDEEEEEDPHVAFAQCLVPYLAQVPESHQASLRMALTNVVFCYIENAQGRVPTISPKLMHYISPKDELSP